MSFSSSPSANGNAPSLSSTRHAPPWMKLGGTSMESSIWLDFASVTEKSTAPSAAERFTLPVWHSRRNVPAAGHSNTTFPPSNFGSNASADPQATASRQFNVFFMLGS